LFLLAVVAAYFTRTNITHAFTIIWTVTIMEISTSTVNLFVCDTRLKQNGGGKSYLEADYTIQCGSYKHRGMQTLGMATIITWAIVIPVTLFLRMYRRRQYLNPMVPQWSFATSVSDDLGAVSSDDFGGSSGERKTVEVTFKMNTKQYERAAEAVSRAKILAFGNELGLKREDACGVHENDGTRGIAWETRGFVPEELMHRAKLSGGVIKHKYFERYLKEGMRCIAELENPDILDFKALYRDTVPNAWWFELLGYASRAGYAVVPTLPDGLQEVAGALLSGFMVALTAYVRPYRRPSDTLMQMAANISLLAFFIAHDRQTLGMGAQLNTICLCLPAAMIIFWIFKAYLLPSRRKLWSEEQALLGFDDEFMRQWLADKEADEDSQAAVLRGARSKPSSARMATALITASEDEARRSSDEVLGFRRSRNSEDEGFAISSSDERRSEPLTAAPPVRPERAA